MMDYGKITNLKEWQAAMSALAKRGAELMDGPAEMDDEDADDDAPELKATNPNTSAPKVTPKDDAKEADEDDDDDY